MAEQTPIPRLSEAQPNWEAVARSLARVLVECAPDHAKALHAAAADDLESAKKGVKSAADFCGTDYHDLCGTIDALGEALANAKAGG